MKVLVAASETQGQRSYDFTWCRDGELVKFGMECDGEAVDGACGCRRSMVGVESNKATTTLKVAEIDITKEGMADALRANYQNAGWYQLMGAEGAEESIKKEVDELIDIAAGFPVGSVVEKRGDKLQIRLKSPRMVR